jgi:hypoxanthine-DNA glycosylase
MLTGLPPLVSPQTRLLVLGSFPGVASLAAQQYYGHPQNQFWRILQAIWPGNPCPAGVDSYQNRSDWLLARRLGVWDVYAACEREGSLDSAIRQPVVNDFASLRQLCPALEAIAHNGGESFRHSRKIAPTLATACAALPPEEAISPWAARRRNALGRPSRSTGCHRPARPMPPGLSSANWRPGAKYLKNTD